jgi:acyl-coenzyme A synthetase/AMP-(fatty) acid ligase
VTYRTLAHGIENAANYFASNITDKTKPVTVALPSPPKMLVASFGLLRAGFSIIINSLQEVVRMTTGDSDTLVYEHGETPPEGRTNIVFEDAWLDTGGRAASRLAGLPPLPNMRPAEIYFFTSGTTGRPKRVVRIQPAWDQRILVNVSTVFGDYERVLLVTGVNGSMGFSGAYEALFAGKTICFAPQGQPKLWLANTYDIDLILASPQQALALAELQEKVTRYPLAALKMVRIGGSIVSPGGIQRIKNQLCRNITLSYGSTEAGTAAMARHDMIAHIPNAVGFVAPGVDVQIVDAADKVVPTGSEGFVRLRTPQLLANLQTEDSNMWFYPGDVGWLTAERVLCIAGRKGDVLNRGGINLSIADFEEFLRSCPGVADAGVCTEMGSSGFEEVWVGVVLEPTADIGALRQKVESNSNFGPNIDKLFVVDAIPRTELGKILRGELKKNLQDIAEDTDAADRRPS